MVDRNSCFALSLPKAGSVLANYLVRYLGAEMGMNLRSLMDEFFSGGIADADIPVDPQKTSLLLELSTVDFAIFPLDSKLP